MDAAAKHIQLLRQSTLPTLPYQLAKGTERRFRVPPDNVSIVEEHEYRQLQYMTLIDVDRGLLFTRAYYDMREEPLNPSVAKEGNSEKKPKTKLSLSDYKNKKKTYDSPPDSAASTTIKPSALRKEITDARPERDPVRRDAGARLRESDPHRDGRSSAQAQDAHNDRYVRNMHARYCLFLVADKARLTLTKLQIEQPTRPPIETRAVRQRRQKETRTRRRKSAITQETETQHHHAARRSVADAQRRHTKEKRSRGCRGARQGASVAS